MALFGDRGNEPNGNDPLNIRDGNYATNFSTIAGIVIGVVVLIILIFFI